MNKKALTKHDIYRKLTGFSEKELQAIAGFIDSMQQRKRPKGEKLLKLKGTLKGCDIDLSELKQFRERTWQHVEQESENG